MRAPSILQACRDQDTRPFIASYSARWDRAIPNREPPLIYAVGGGSVYTFAYSLSCGSRGTSRRAKPTCASGGFDFAFASLIFDGITVAVEDRRRDHGEKRMVAIGQADGVHLTVVYTDRPDDRGGSRRIISARRSNRRERRIYAEATKI